MKNVFYFTEHLRISSMITTTGLITMIDYSPSGEVVIIHVQISEPLSFAEGQFMLLQTLIDGKIVKRSYSICSTNQDLQDSQIISFSIKRKEFGVFSTWATKVAKPGMQITMTWPLGKFVDKKLSRNYLFISVWSWLSPCLSIYNHLFRTGEYNKIANLFGEQKIAHIPDTVMEAYTKMDDRIYNQICLSREMNTTYPSVMRSGYVQGALDDALAFLDTDDMTVFICWLPAMCDEVRDILLSKWLSRERLIIEKY